MPQAKEVIYTITDDDGHVSQTSVRIPSDTAAADATAFASDVATLLDEVIDGVISRIGISEVVTPPGGRKTAALASCDVEVGATLFYAAVGNFVFRHRIPTWKISMIVTDGSVIDQAQQAVIDWRDMMINGITPVATLVQPCEWRDADITAFNVGSQTFTKTR